MSPPSHSYWQALPRAELDGETVVVGVAAMYGLSTQEESHVADVAHRAAEPHLSPGGHHVRRRAAAGEVFLTVADDHKRCLVGAHTHNVTLSPAEKQEMMGLVQTMVRLSYLKMEDVPQIPTRKTALQVAGVAGTGATMGRPTCAVLPEAINSARTAASFGCIGNRVYTGADDTEAYFAIPGLQLGAVEEKLAVIVRANQEMEKFHRGRAAATPTA
ncbi:MAG TPA: hypothetical protein VGV06_20260 [Methylomirabilota bacterium]|nr:hypothetical protein [Methylomirabilota bacterium]